MTSKRNGALFAALLAATALAAGAAAYGQPAGPLWDAAQLPETRGIVKQYALTPRGDIDGLILTDGTEVTLPPHLSTQIAFAVRPGDAVTVRGFKDRSLPLIDAASVTNFVTGATVVDNGPPPGPDRGAAQQTISGRIAADLYGKRGEVNGAVLDNGAILRMPPPEAERIGDIIASGRMVTARGAGLISALGTVFDVSAIGPSPDRMTELRARTPPRTGGPGDFGPPQPPPPPPRRG
jgi:hypothetical protein